MTDEALVSVVIPTHARPTLVGRAIASVFAQTEHRIEVIVVLDGPDPATMNVLSTFSDPRLRTVLLDPRGGAQAARNAGIATATAPWVALLDDDDEWLPRKLETQLEVAGRSAHRFPVVSSRLIYRSPEGEVTRPRPLPRPGQPVSEYFAVRHSAFYGEGFLSTSTLLAPTELFRRVPFTEGLPRFQDFDWAIHAACVPGVSITVVPKPLAICNDDGIRDRISHAFGWRVAFDWVRSNRELFTPRAYAAAMTGLVSSLAVETRDPRVFVLLLREAIRHGRPTLVELVTFAQVWLVPKSVRLRIRDLATRKRRRARVV